MERSKVWLRAHWKSLLLGLVLGGGLLAHYVPRFLKMTPKEAIELAVKETLIAPATAKFVSVDILEQENFGNTQYYFGYVVVDAQNKFGALIRNKFCVIVAHEEEKRAFRMTGIDGVMECPTVPQTETERHEQKRLVGWSQY